MRQQNYFKFQDSLGMQTLSTHTHKHTLTTPTLTHKYSFTHHTHTYSHTRVKLSEPGIIPSYSRKLRQED